jgi:hypothetical protein
MPTWYQTRISFDYLRDYTLGSPILRAELTDASSIDVGAGEAGRSTCVASPTGDEVRRSLGFEPIRRNEAAEGNPVARMGGANGGSLTYSPAPNPATVVLCPSPSSAPSPSSRFAPRFCD